jgi:hypothetical protein
MLEHEMAENAARGKNWTILALHSTGHGMAGLGVKG